MGTMLQVPNQSMGRSAASGDKFVRLYRRAVEELSGPRSMGAVTASVWEDFDRSQPGADFTLIFPFVENSSPLG
jgi:hypothetical protein